MRGWMCVFVLLLVSAFALVPSQSVSAAPPQADKAGYSIITALTTDPQDPTGDAASFTADVQAIYAWTIIVSTGGAADKQFKAEVEFVSPYGDTVDSEWFGSDTGNVTSIAKEKIGSLGVKNIARKRLNIAGTPSASSGGQWTVNFIVGGKVSYVGNFTLEGKEGGNDDLANAARNDLEKKGYEVTTFETTEMDDGKTAALVGMPMISKNPYSGDTTQQIVDGFEALRTGFPSAEVLFCSLKYSDRYDIVYNIKTPDWDAYAKSKDFNKFLNALRYGVWDSEAGEYITGAKDFMSKNFGGGTYQAPGKPEPKSGTVGAVKVALEPNELPADGSSTADITVTVLDKNNKPVVGTTVSIKVSGAGLGTVDPPTARTDSKGKVVATYTAGTKNGSATITASVGNTSGTAVMTLTAGKQSSDCDDACSNVTATMTEQCWDVLGVSYNADKLIATVVVDIGTPFDTSQMGLAVVIGSISLRSEYPNAKSLVTGMPYKQAYLLAFPAAATDVDTMVKGFQAAKNDTDKTTVLQNFLTRVYGNASVVDIKSGKVVSGFKDFANKNFGGG